ncbi:MAG TPA: hypothetical protein VGG64_07285 [Pirellulales bacterium]|jgi:hypothetical protein
MHKRQAIVLLAFAGFWLGVAATASADISITDGFENPNGYDLAASGGGSASIRPSPDPAYAGDQSLRLSLGSASDYARVKLDISSSNITLGQITSADYFVDRLPTSSDQLPYLILSINTPGSGGDSTLAVMYNDPASITPNTWTDLTVDPNQTLFHIEGDTSGLLTPSSMTLAQLDGSDYSPGMSWGSFSVNFVRIGYGSAGDDETPTTAYVDNLTINAASPVVPEPSTIVVWSGLIILGSVAHCRRRRVT